jgi:hypothetical protein
MYVTVNVKYVTVNTMRVTGHKLRIYEHNACDKLLDIGMWVPVTTGWRVLGLRMEMTANILNN